MRRSHCCCNAVANPVEPCYTVEELHPHHSKDDDGYGFADGDSVVDFIEVINLATGSVTEGPALPGNGLAGCAAVHDGYIYWVKGENRTGSAVYDPTNEVYRAKSELPGSKGFGAGKSVMIIQVTWLHCYTLGCIAKH